MKFLLIAVFILLFPPFGAADNSDVDYQRGLELAKLQRFEEAREAFLNGLRHSPNDKRFPTELAGIAFRQNHYALAKSYLHRALKLDPADPYLSQFQGTIYLLEGNLQAALLHWNRIGRPQIEKITTPGNLKIKSTLLDRAFLFSPLNLLKLSDLEETNARLRLLEIFPRFSFELSARQDEKFDLIFHGLEKNGAGNTKYEALLSVFHGLPYQAVYPEFYNWHGEAINLSSLVRWDSDKQRLYGSISSPIASDPKYRLQISLDGRRERWHIAALTPDFKLKETEGALGLDAVFNDHWSISNSVAFSNTSITAGTPLNEGPEADYKFKLLHDYDFPEQNVQIRSFVSARIGRLFHNDSSSLFSQIEGGSELRIGAMRTSLRFAKSFGSTPFSQEYILGIDRDTDLWLRAHNGLRKKKGVLPMGRDFVLMNWEADKRIYSHPLFVLKAGPFIDSGRTGDTSPYLGSHRWLLDAGFQVKALILHTITTVLVIGRDTVSRNNTVYVNIIK